MSAEHVAALEAEIHALRSQLADAQRMRTFAIEPPEEEAHSIFALPKDYDRQWLTLFIMILIGVTILYERITDILEERVFSSGIKAKVFQKILRELTVLGFVSFSATIMLQAIELEEKTHMLFEYAHVLMFTIAIMYALEISIVAILFKSIADSFAKQDEANDEDLLASERKWVMRVDKLSGFWRYRARSAWLVGGANGRLFSTSQFRVLRFHFMTRSGLLGKARFGAEMQDLNARLS